MTAKTCAPHALRANRQFLHGPIITLMLHQANNLQHSDRQIVPDSDARRRLRYAVTSVAVSDFPCHFGIISARLCVCHSALNLRIPR